MNTTNPQVSLPEEIVLQKIFFIRGQKVMLDADLAELYGIPTKVMKQAVKRNLSRFPTDFMFVLTSAEFKNLRSQFVTSSWGGVRYLPMVFTEQGVAMLSSILNSERAILVNIRIIRIFVKLRGLTRTSDSIIAQLKVLEKKFGEHDQAISNIFEYLKELEKDKMEEEDFKNRKRIGFLSKDDK